MGVMGVWPASWEAAAGKGVDVVALWGLSSGMVWRRDERGGVVRECG